MDETLLKSARKWLEGADGDATTRELVENLANQLEMYQGLLVAEQEDCQLQRKNKEAEWQRAEGYLSLLRSVESHFSKPNTGTAGALWRKVAAVVGR